MTTDINHFSPAVITDSGQCFRMRKTKKDHYEIIAFNRLLKLKQLSKNRFDLDCDRSEFDAVWRPYFDIDRDYESLLRFIDRKDLYLQKATAFGKGMKILKQDPFEMLISFIISQRKSIPAIRKCIDALCEISGEYIGKSDFDHKKLYTFPKADALSALTEKELNSCMLGYRSKYIMSTAKAVESEELDLKKLSTLSSEALITELLKCFGVGIKVASCTALFGFHRLEIFPIDVWIKRILEKEYQGIFPLKGCKHPEEYKKYAGILQQYMFYYERSK